MADEAKKEQPKEERKPETAAPSAGGKAEAAAAPAPGETPAKPPEPPVDVEALKAKARERDEFLDLARRATADFINYRKRIDRERSEWPDHAAGEFALKLLPVLDDFDRAVAEADADEAAGADTLRQGFRQIREKLYDVLKAAGIEPFEPRGIPFDPAEHDAVIVEETDDLPHHHVMEVVRKGYRLKGRILRPAQVKVARNAPKEEPTSKEPPAQKPREDGGTLAD